MRIKVSITKKKEIRHVNKLFICSYTNCAFSWVVGSWVKNKKDNKKGRKSSFYQFVNVTFAEKQTCVDRFSVLSFRNCPAYIMITFLWVTGHRNRLAQISSQWASQSQWLAENFYTVSEILIDGKKAVEEW